MVANATKDAPHNITPMLGVLHAKPPNLRVRSNGHSGGSVIVDVRQLNGNLTCQTMNHFKILAHGQDFDVDLALSGSSLGPDDVWHIGERSPSEKVASTSGFVKFLGDGTKLNVYEQQSLAFDFVNNNREVLAKCGPQSGGEHFLLFIQRRIEIDNSLAGFFTDITLRLTAITLPLKLQVVTFVDLVRLDRDW